MTKDDIWAAGLLSMTGSFTVIKAAGNNKNVRLVVRSAVHTQAIERLADIAGVNTVYSSANGTRFAQIALSGEPLHHFMEQVWDELNPQRKREYIKSRRKAGLS